MSMAVRDLNEEINLGRASMASIRGGMGIGAIAFGIDPDRYSFDIDPDFRPVKPLHSIGKLGLGAYGGMGGDRQ